MNRIIILGSSGFLGSSIREKLSEKKLCVKYMIHKKKYRIKHDEFFGDILDKDFLLKTVQNNDIVLNLVGQYDENLGNFFNTNLVGSFNLLETVKLKKNIRVIFASSINVYGNNCKISSTELSQLHPLTSYGVVKSLTEQLYAEYSKLYGINTTILRFSNLYGKNKKSGIISKILKSSSSKPVIFTHNGNLQRDFLFIDDAVSAIIKILDIPSKNFEIFNISSNTKISPKQIIKLIYKISKKKIHYKLLKENTDEKCIWANNLKIRKKINFIPQISIEEGIKLLLE